MAQTPTDPTKAQVWITKGIDDLDFEFYFPQGPKGDPGGITLGTALGTNHLDQYKTAGVYRQDSGTPATLLNGYPIAATGVLYVDDRLGGGSSVIQTYYPFTGASGINPRQFYKRYSVSSTTWGPWEAYVAQRVDQTAGRAIYTWDTVNQRDQLIYGDTGWRDTWTDVLAIDSAATKIAGFTGSRIRRTLQHVHIEFGINTATTNMDWRPAIMPNASWRPDAPGNIQWTAAQTGSSGVVHFAPINYVRNWTAGNVLIIGTYPCSGPWPTTLPGVASGTIPNL